ncbi:DNA demethylase ALKBH1 [Armadillidium vulgare]|nr:DNA demethylase ALKBH1 [Armadillidium vulgare]
MSWIKKCLQQFSESPYKTNLSNLRIDLEGKSWWSSIKGSLSRDEPTKLVSQLRWSTIGYHHNWDTKEYSEVDKSPVPNEVEFLCPIIFMWRRLIQTRNFKAEAGIVNYYPPGTTLSPHTDYSEPNKEAPLLSFSFGRSGIFLIGSHNKETTPTPIFLHHGDVMIMSENSRLCYHAVPRIMSDEDIKNTAVHSCFNAFLSHWNNVLKELEANKSNEMASTLLTYDDLLAILNYIKEIRINFNVRQVHG